MNQVRVRRKNAKKLKNRELWTPPPQKKHPAKYCNRKPPPTQKSWYALWEGHIAYHRGYMNEGMPVYQHKFRFQERFFASPQEFLCPPPKLGGGFRGSCLCIFQTDYCLSYYRKNNLYICKNLSRLPIYIKKYGRNFINGSRVYLTVQILKFSLKLLKSYNTRNRSWLLGKSFSNSEISSRSFWRQAIFAQILVATTVNLRKVKGNNDLNWPARKLIKNIFDTRM